MCPAEPEDGDEPATRPAPLSAHDFPELKPVEPDNYALGNELARGGMGRIRTARDRRLRREVAIKELLVSSPDLVRRFEREAFITARLQHPAIVNIHEAGRWPTGEPFFAMKRVKGLPLSKVIERTPTLDGRLALLPHVIAVAEALAYAHSQHIVHRDLKPSNVLVGEFGETVVIDWGLAKDLDAPEEPSATPLPVSPAGETATEAGAVLGTPAYMPPEQALGNPVDERADVYALGAILYEVLGGQPPRRGTGDQVVLEALSRPPTPLHLKQPGIPQDLLDIVAKAMARSLAARYPSARELAEDLERFASGRLVSAHKYSRGELVLRWLRRRAALVGLAAASLIALTTVGVISLRSVLRERERATDRADQLAVLHARSALDEDEPLHALAWLDDLAPRSRWWPLARLVAEGARARGLPIVLSGHESLVWALAYSADGKTLFSAGEDGTVRAWDVASAEWRVLGHHDRQVNDVAVSPDGTLVASGGDDNAVQLHAWRTGASRTLAGHTGSIHHVLFCADGRLISAGEEGTLRVWDPAGGEARVLQGYRGSGLVICLGDDVVAAPGENGTVRLWDLVGGGVRDLAGHRGPVRWLARSPDGRLLASASEDRDVRLWNLATGESRVLAGHEAQVNAVAFSPDGALLASASADTTVRLWPVAGGEVRVLRGHTGGADRVVFTPDGHSLISGSKDGTARIWELATLEARVLRGLQIFSPLALAPDAQSVATAGPGGSLRIWSLETRRVLRGHQGHVSELFFPPGGASVISSGRDGTIRLWDLASGQGRIVGRVDADAAMALSADGTLFAAASDQLTLLDLRSGQARTLPGQDDAEALAISPDGRLIASGGADGRVRIWSVAGGAPRELGGHTRVVSSLDFSPDGRWLASASEDMSVRLWEVASGSSRVWTGHTQEVEEVTFSPDGELVASAGWDGTARVWPVGGGDGRVALSQKGVISSLSFSPDGRHLASASLDGTAGLWERASGQARYLPLREGQVTSVQWSPDGQRLAAVAQSSSLWLWDVTTGGGCAFPGQGKNIITVGFTPDGRHLVTGHFDGTLRVWDDDLPLDEGGLRAALARAAKGRPW